MTTQQLPPLPEQSMTHHITDEQIGQIAEQVGLVGPASRVGDCHAAAHRFARAVLALAAPQGEPYGWAVTGCHSLYRGEWAESTAQAEAKRCGGTARAFPLYTAPAPAVPSLAVTPEMLRAAQMRTELGAYACANMSSAYTLITELFQNMLAASPACEQPAVPEDVARDAERYRWLRDMASQDWLHRNHNYQNLRGAAFDAAIDAARAAEKGGE